MSISPQIIFRNMDPSEAIEEDVRRRVAQLERFHQRLSSCRVTIDAPEIHHHHHPLFRVHIDLKVPGEEVNVGHEHWTRTEHTNFHVALRDAFLAAERSLKGVSGRRRSLRRHP